MKRNWRRGLLLGVSMALLLSGGVALAAQSISIAPWCEVCCPYINNDLDPSADNLTCDPYRTITSHGWGAGESLDLTLISPGTRPPDTYPGPPLTADSAGNFEFLLGLACWRGDQIIDGPHVSQGWVLPGPGPWQADDYGRWGVELEGTTDKVEGAFHFVEDLGDCEVEVEFVPEPGSMLLLGSGLAGLAGYATLRWRARE